MKRILLLLSFLLLASCTNDSPDDGEPTTAEKAATVPIINYSVVKTYPHDTALFTEGLLVHEGKLFESTGSPGGALGPRSLIGTIDLATGKFDKKVELDRSKYFGEGIVFLNGKLYQLTYKTQIGFIYDAHSFKQIGTFRYTNAEGWSLTTDGQYLIMSDGTSQLTYLTPDSLNPVKTLPVTEDGAPLQHLNELEYIKGYLYANIWMTNNIVKIDPSNGKVIGKLILGSLEMEAKARNPGIDVLNGIAYDAAKDKIYVTGKLWPNIYEISFPH
jgi:glutamine cyclotransferase